MKQILRRTVRWLLPRLVDELDLLPAMTRYGDDAVAQKTLAAQYRLLAAHGKQCLPGIANVGFRKYSQFEEDGILLYIFSLIEPINRTCVEICVANGLECNTTNLIINHGWWGHLFDGSAENVRDGNAFFAKHKDTALYPPRFTHAWITAENVNEKISNSGAKGPIDLLSLDIDGMDYWVWKAISIIEPQVVVCETHNPIPPDKAWTVPYDPKFVYESTPGRRSSVSRDLRRQPAARAH